MNRVEPGRLDAIEAAIDEIFMSEPRPLGFEPTSQDVTTLLETRYTLIRLDGPGAIPDLPGISPGFISIARGGHRAVGAATLGNVGTEAGGASLRTRANLRALRDGATGILSPMTGAPLTVNTTLGTEWFFHASDTEFCLSSQFSETMTFVNLETVWVLPRSHWILYVSNGFPEAAIRRHTAKQFLRFLKRPALTNAYVRDCDQQAARKTTLTDFFCPHMSHNLWNLQTGWANVLMEGETGSIDTLLPFGGQNFFGSLRELFGNEIKNTTRIVEVGSEDQIFNLTIEQNLFVLTVKDEFFTPPFAGRVLQRAYASTGDGFKAEVAAFRDRCSPIILTTIRLDNRAWIEQEQGLAFLFSKLHEEFPNLGLIIDGLSSDTVKGWTTGWMSLEADTKMAEAVCMQLPRDLPCKMAVGRPFAESIVLMDTCDFFVAPSGSGMAIYKWICNKPGFAFSNKAVLDPQSPHRWPLRVWHDQTFRHDMVPTRHLPPTFVQDGDEARDHVSRANFHLDWQDLYGEVIKFIRDLDTHGSALQHS